MNKNYKLSLFVFRRDLRLEDNTALIAALNHSDDVLPCFILDPRQIQKNSYKSDHCITFMVQSLYDLHEQLKHKSGRLYLFYGNAEAVIQDLVEHLGIDAVFVNHDYTPFSKKRDNIIERVCKKNKVVFNVYDDALLHQPEATLKANGQPYVVFTAYYNNARKLPAIEPVGNHHNNYYKKPVKYERDLAFISQFLPEHDKSRVSPGGRRNALALLKKIKNLGAYDKDKDYPALDATSHLSSHLKFTTCSIREVYYACINALGKKHALIRQLYWRDFFTMIANYFPHIFGAAFREKYNNLAWSDNKILFKKWCQGKTGFPIVDAGMRQLNQTGFMHNRVRLIVGSFLVKDLHIDWRWGEKYFAQKLIDYDPAVNNGNWQWVASTGCDAQPYFRIFNPWLQQKKYDPDAVYIKEWVPELKNIAPKLIHQWFKKKVQAEYAQCDYQAPVVDHDLESKIAKKLYR